MLCKHTDRSETYPQTYTDLTTLKYYIVYLVCKISALAMFRTTFQNLHRASHTWAPKHRDDNAGNYFNRHCTKAWIYGL